MCRESIGHSPLVKLFIEPLDGASKPLPPLPTRKPTAGAANKPESRLPELNSKSWAEATIPVPLFALVHVKNLQSELAFLRAESDRLRSHIHFNAIHQVETQKQLLDLRTRLQEKELAFDNMSCQAHIFRLAAQRNCDEALYMQTSLEQSQGELSIAQFRLEGAKLEIEMLRRILETTQHIGAGDDVSLNYFMAVI